MYLLSHALPLATFFSTIALVSATPQGTTTIVPLSPASQPTNATNPIDPRQCVRNRRPGPFSQRYMILRQCLDAISQLPSHNQVGTFRDYEPGDDYFLPQVRKAQTCQVTVSLPYGYNSEQAVWDELKIEANYLGEKCCALSLSDNQSPSLLALEGKNNKGAWVPAGQHGKIRINLDYIPQGANEPTPSSIAGNATNSTSDAVTGHTTALAIAGNGMDITSDSVLAA